MHGIGHLAAYFDKTFSSVQLWSQNVYTIVSKFEIFNLFQQQ